MHAITFESAGAPPAMPAAPRRAVVWTAIVVWAIAAAAGCWIFWQAEARPGAVGNVPARWAPASPADAAFAPAIDRPTLVVALHPRCACSPATVSEVTTILALCGGPDRLAIRILVARPAGAPADWDRTALVESARLIPGARVTGDPGGATAGRLGARTSGHVVLLAADGRVLFAGGVTPSRGHAGDNPGRAAVVAAVLAGNTARAAAAPAYTPTPVYGCLLDGPAAATAPTVP